MRSCLFGVVSAVLFACITASSNLNAALLNRAGGMIYDDVLNITWIADTGLAQNDVGTNLNWGAAVQWANNLVYGGYSDWRLPSMNVNGDGIFVDCRTPSVSELECRDNEYDYLFTQYGISTNTPGDFLNITNQHYWSGSENPAFPSLAYLFNFESGFRGTTSKITANRGAFAVRAGDVSAIPAPAALWLFGSGLLGMLGVARNKNALPERGRT